MLSVKITGTLEAWAKELSARGLRNAVRRALDQSATAARKVALDNIAKDIGAPKARVKEAVSKVRRTSLANLSAAFTSGKLRVGIMNTAGAAISRGGGLIASTHRLGGGGSSSLHVPQAFIVNTSAGGRFVAVRVKGAKRLPIKGIYAEHPGTAMGQTGAPAAKAWEKSAQAETGTRLHRELQKQLFNERMPYTAPVDTSD